MCKALRGPSASGCGSLWFLALGLTQLLVFTFDQLWFIILYPFIVVNNNKSEAAFLVKTSTHEISWKYELQQSIDRGNQI